MRTKTIKRLEENKQHVNLRNTADATQIQTDVDATLRQNNIPGGYIIDGYRGNTG